MNNSIVKILSIFIFVVIGVHFFHSEFDLFSSEAEGEHHASHDYCQLIDSAVPSKSNVHIAKDILTYYQPAALLINSEKQIDLNFSELLTDRFFYEDCPDYILNRTILI